MKRELQTGQAPSRAARVARWFGVDETKARDRPDDQQAPPPDITLTGGQLILLTGASGSGKSTLLRRLRKRHGGGARWHDLTQVRLARHATVIDAMTDSMGGGGDTDAAIVAALEALSRVGLGEVWTYLRTPAELSEGQRWRLRLALALARSRTPAHRASRLPPPLAVLAADEFAAPLDRVTAMVVARALRRAVTARPDLCAIVATGHHDLVPALDPDVIVRCDFGTFELQRQKGERHES